MRYVVTTGFPKSGTTFLENLLWGLEEVGGHSVARNEMLRLRLRPLRVHPGFRRVLSDSDVPFDTAARMIVAPSPCRAVVPNGQAHSLRAAMGEIAWSVLRKDAISIAADSHERAVDRLADPLLGEGSRWETKEIIAGAPDKHSSQRQLLEALPSFTIVQLLRDPRDILVSSIYHDLRLMRDEHIAMYAARRAGHWSPREDWREAVASRRALELADYFDGAELEESDTVKLARFENFVADAPAALVDLLSSLGVAPACASLQASLDAAGFDRMRARGRFQRGTHYRKGKVGGWRDSIDRRLAEQLRGPFAELVTELGYEADDSWIDDAPEKAPEPIDFSWFVPEQVIANRFMRLWHENAQLRESFPDPLIPAGSGGFADWLIASSDPEVREWIGAADALARAWRGRGITSVPARLATER